MSKKKRLGKGLDALLGGGESGASLQDVSKEIAVNDKLTTLPIEKLQRGEYQPRSHMDQDSLQELSDSISTQGIIQPILVRPVGDEGQYEIIAIQRENLNPIEEAVGLKRLMDEFTLTHQQAAESVGRSRSAVSNLLRLLSLNEAAKDLVFDGKLEMGHARALLALPYEQQNAAAQPKKKKVSADIQHLEQELSDKLNADVSIQDNNGKGKLVISYQNLDVLDGILSKIK